jgi:steroid 5-alpha reductase family enzyme
MGASADTSAQGLGRDFALCALAYGAAGVVALAVGFALSDEHPILVAAVADVAATLVVFAFSTAFHNSSFYDPYWSVAPVVIAVYWAVAPTAVGVDIVRQLVVVLLVIWWAMRLTYNWLRRWEGLGHEDWRYVDFRQQYGRRYWLIDLSGIHLFPTVIVFLGCLSLYSALSSGTSAFGVLDVIATGVTAAAITIETVADQQLWRFLNGPREPGTILSTGLWAYSRHPNYFGEILFWWGLFLFGLAADSSYWWTIVGPVAMVLMFMFASVPMIDRRSVERRPGYAAHMAKVSAIVPWFPKR